MGANMRVTIASAPKGILGGMRVDQLQVGRTHDLPTRVARALIAEGYAHEERRSENRRGKKNKQKAALLSARRGDVVDVLERVLTKGVVFDIEEGTVGASEAGGGAAAWFRVSIAGVDVFKVEASLSWRYLLETEEEEE
jgi:hypothetical protein